MHYRATHQAGFSFVELLVTAALVALVFGGLFGVVNGMIQLISSSKAKAGATALAVERIEYIRSLPYYSIGTVSGVPAGTIPQNATSTLNGITYAERIVVEYVDDPADGFGGADSNGILADYKRVKVEISWQGRNASSSIALVTSVMPIGIESTAGGGTIRVNVFDAAALPVANAAVRFLNDTTAPTIDTIRYTNTDGIAYLAGAPAGANYQITASRSGYSTDGTIQATTSNPNPTTQPISVVESAVSTMNFQIDRLSALDIETVGIATTGQFLDAFTDDTLVMTYASTTRASDAVELESASGSYVASGTIMSATTSPSVLESWEAVSFTASTTASTSVRVSLYYENAGVLTLVPDIDLSGNSSGFTGGPVLINTLDISTYDTLALGATLTTVDPDETPLLEEWSIDYTESQPSVANVDFTLTGTKLIGEDASSNAIYKVAVTDTTDGSGAFRIDPLEWDVYTLDITDPSYQIVEVCPTNPLSVSPNTDRDMSVTLRSYTGPQLLVTVTDVTGYGIPNATVELDKTVGSYNETLTSSLCGQAAFYSGGISTDSDYTLTVSVPGFTTAVLPDVVVSPTSTITVLMN